MESMRRHGRMWMMERCKDPINWWQRWLS